MEYILSTLVLVLNCKFGDLALKTKERLTGEEKEKEKGKKVSQMILHQKILFLWNHSISWKYGDSAYIEKVKMYFTFSSCFDFSTKCLYSM